MSFKTESWSSSVFFSSALSSSCFLLRRLIRRIIRKIENATMRKSTRFWRKLPYLIWAASAVPNKLGMVISRLVKLTPPTRRPTRGMTISLTREVTIEPKAPPMITPTARSMTLPRLMNSLNSVAKDDL